MEGRICPEGMSHEQFAEAQRLWEITQEAMADEQWRLCCLLAGKADDQLLGQNEFDMRDRLLRMGARTLEAVVNDRRKKGATPVVALLAPVATRPLASSTGGRKRS